MFCRFDNVAIRGRRCLSQAPQSPRVRFSTTYRVNVCRRYGSSKSMMLTAAIGIGPPEDM